MQLFIDSICALAEANFAIIIDPAAIAAAETAVNDAVAAAVATSTIATTSVATARHANEVDTSKMTGAAFATVAVMDNAPITNTEHASDAEAIATKAEADAEAPVTQAESDTDAPTAMVAFADDQVSHDNTNDVAYISAACKRLKCDGVEVAALGLLGWTLRYHIRSTCTSGDWYAISPEGIQYRSHKQLQLRGAAVTTLSAVQ